MGYRNKMVRGRNDYYRLVLPFKALKLLFTNETKFICRQDPSIIGVSLITGKDLIAVVLWVGVCLGVVAVYVWQGGQTGENAQVGENFGQTGENAQVGENFEVVYEWWSWTGVYYTITIKDNGTTIETYSRFGEDKTTKIGTLAENELQEFKNLVMETNVFDFEDTYPENYPPGYYTEASGTGLTFTIAGKTKTISGGVFPENLWPILRKIHEFRTLWW
ncbi:MAG: hypothetical protein QXH08_00360 [Candidatus Hadarchaeales archaeon]